MDWRRIRSRFLDWIWSDWMSWGTRREDGGRGLSWRERLGWVAGESGVDFGQVRPTTYVEGQN
jgi:hypothetical protein